MADGQEYTSYEGPTDYESAEITYDAAGDGFGTQTVAAASTEALIVKDCRPWDTDANEQVLDDLDVEYDVIPSSQVAETELETYEIVVLASTQGSSYYERLTAAATDLEAFVAAGGTLVAHATDNGWPCATQWDESFLPGGVQKENTLQDTLSIEAESHPLVAGLSDETLSDWNSSTHGYLTNLPENATVVTTIEGDETRPTYADYAYESGQVLVTMQPMEWPYTGSVGSRPENPRTLLRTELEVALEGEQERRISAQSTILHYINGENENVQEGGNPLHSAQMQVFPLDDTYDVPLTGIPSIPSASVTLPFEPILDNWQKGDMMMEPDPDLTEATKRKAGKNFDEFGTDEFNQYRFKNQVDVSFTSPDGETIDEESLRIQFNEKGSSNGTVEYKGEEEVYTVLVGDEINNLKTDEWFDTLRERGTRVDRDYSIRSVEIDGVEGIRVSTISAGYAGFAHEIADRMARNPIHFFATIFGWYDAVSNLPGLDDLPDAPSWDDLPDPPDAPSWDDISDLPNTPGWDDIPDLPDRPGWDDVDTPSWDDVPDFPDDPSWDDVPDLPDRPGWDDVPDTDDIPNPDCDDIPGIDGCPDPDVPLLSTSASGATATETAGSLETVVDDRNAATSMHARRTGVDAVDLSPEEIIDRIAPYLPDVIGAINDLMTVVPNIYSFYDLTVLADGRRFTRVWDTSRFPSNALYIDGKRTHLNIVPYERKQLFSSRMTAFFILAKAGVSPYKGIDSKENYLNWLRARQVMDNPESVLDEYGELDDVLRNATRIFPDAELDASDLIADTPRWIAGHDEAGNRISDPESYLDADIPNPF